LERSLTHSEGEYTTRRGRTIGYEDVFTKIEKARRHFEEVGLGADYVERFIRA
jgi:hypothetical protein